MAGFDLMTISSVVMCAHGGKVTLTMINPRVKTMGQMTLTAPCPCVIAGCAFPPPPVANGPCVTAVWSMGAVRVKSNGMPLLLQNPAHASATVTITSGTPLMLAPIPGRVKAL